MNAIIQLELLLRVDCGSIYKSYVCLNKTWNNEAKKMYPNADIEFASNIRTLLKLYPYENWNRSRLSDNAKITWQDVISNKYVYWKFDILSAHLPIDIIIANPKRWSYGHMSSNPTITIDYVLSDFSDEWDFTLLSANPGITWQDVIDYPMIPWDYQGLSENPNITWEIICANPDKPWNYFYLSLNPNITWEIVLANLDKDWSPTLLMQNPNICITWKIVCEHPEFNWPFDLLSRHKCVTLDIVKNNPDLPWDYEELTINPNITIEDILNNPDIDWNYNMVPMNKNITWSIIVKYYKRFDMDPADLAYAHCLNWKIVRDNYKKIKWDFNVLSGREF